MSQHIDPTPKQTDLDALNGKIMKHLGNGWSSEGSISVDLSNFHVVIAIIVPQDIRPSERQTEILAIGGTTKVNGIYGASRSFTVTPSGISWTLSDNATYPQAFVIPATFYGI